MLCSGLFFIASGRQKYLFRVCSLLSIQVFDVRTSLTCAELQALTSLFFSSHIFDVLFWQSDSSCPQFLLDFFNFTSNLRVSQTEFHKADLHSFCLRRSTGVFPADILFTEPGKPEVLGLTM